MILGSSQQGPRQAACSGRCSELGRGHRPQAAPSSPHPHLSAPETAGQGPQGGAWLPGSLGPSSLTPPPLWAAPSLGSVRGTCTWPGQEGKVTHTKFNNQQRQIWPPPLPPGCPTPCVQSLRLNPTRFLGRRERGSRCVSLSRLPLWPPPGPWTEGTGDEPRPLTPRAGAATVGCSSPGRGPALGHHSPPSPRAG